MFIYDQELDMNTMPKFTFASLPMALAIMTCLNHAAQAEEMPILVEIEDLRKLPLDSEGHPQHFGTVPSSITLFFHNGSLDTYDLGKPADEALREFALTGDPIKYLTEVLPQTDPDSLYDATAGNSTAI